MKNITFIPQVPRTAIEVFSLLPEGTGAEVLNDILYMSLPLSFEHQQLLMQLCYHLGLWINNKKLGALVAGPFDVYLEEQMSAVQPDIIFISNKNKKIIKEDGYAHGAPDLVIEILSKDVNRDKVIKRDIYEKAGVKEYFIIDSTTKMAECYALKNKRYQQVYSRKRYFQSNLLEHEFSF